MQPVCLSEFKIVNKALVWKHYLRDHWVPVAGGGGAEGCRDLRLGGEGWSIVTVVFNLKVIRALVAKLHVVTGRLQRDC